MAQSDQENRLEKLKKLKKEGINAYPSTSQKTHQAQEVLDGFDKLEGQKIILAGRLMILRSFGKLTFGQLQDASGKIQIVFENKDLKSIDAGDILEIHGQIFLTKKEEKSILVGDFKILSKALEPLPEKWHGIKDEETRYRKRYLDLLLNPELKEMFRKKTIFWQSMRDYFIKQNFQEVETPVLENTPGGADAEPFVTHHNALDIDLYLRISMGELWQKRLMVAGYEKTFEIGRQFRNEGIDPEHLQDYSQMEFYMAYQNYEDGMKLVENMLKEVIEKAFGKLQFKIKEFDIDLNKKWEKIDYVSKIEEELGINVLTASDEEIKNKCSEDITGRGRMIDNLWKQVRKKIGGPAFLINHPVEVSPLAKRKEDNPKLTERFQVLVAGSELGNGYSELNDPLDQEERFQEQAKLREAGDAEAQMHDADFVEALKHGMPPTCGFGLSERVFAFFMDKPIRECAMFPLLKPKNQNTPMTTPKKSTDEKTDIKFNISREESLKLLQEHMKDPANLNHSRESEVIMRALAKHFNEDQELWGALGLLHDVDWEYGEDEHCAKCRGILSEAGYDDFFIETVISHGYGVTDCAKGALKDEKRETKIQHALAAAETITGLIYASALVRPDKKISSVKVKSVKKKMKDKSFAAKVNRGVIKECEEIGLELGEFIEISLKAMQEIEEEIGL